MVSDARRTRLSPRAKGIVALVVFAELARFGFARRGIDLGVDNQPEYRINPVVSACRRDVSRGLVDLFARSTD
jgi:hypothetical protein